VGKRHTTKAKDINYEIATPHYKREEWLTMTTMGKTKYRI